MTAQVSRFTLTEQTIARLGSIDDLVVFLGRADNVPLKPDGSGVVQYVVLHAGAGTPAVGTEDLTGLTGALDWSCQTNCAGATERDVLWVIDQVHAALYGWRPTGLEGINTDGLVPPPGYDPGPIRSNDQADPPRKWLPLQWRLNATP